MEPSFYLGHIGRRAGALAAAGRLDMDAPVPSCPDWTVTDVVRHVGGVHRWCRAIVASGKRADFVGPPADLTGEGLVAWGEEQTAALLETLAGADPDKDVWTFGQPRTVRFWLRRQAHETDVHAWDAEAAVGRAGTLESEMAADGVDEFVGVMVPRLLQAQHGSWAGETVHLHRTDGAGEWLLRMGPDGECSAERAHGKADVALRGTASDLLLWATNRIGPETLEVFGDARLVDRWRGEISF